MAVRGGRRLARLCQEQFGESGLVLVREAPGTRNEFGEYVPGATTNTTLSAVVQPIGLQGGGTVRNILPEGATLSDYRWIDILVDDDQDVRPLRVGTNQTGSDVFQYDGFSWEIFDENVWDKNGHVEAVIVRKDAQDDPARA